MTLEQVLADLKGASGTVAGAARLLATVRARGGRGAMERNNDGPTHSSRTNGLRWRVETQLGVRHGRANPLLLLPPPS